MLDSTDHGGATVRYDGGARILRPDGSIDIVGKRYGSLVWVDGELARPVTRPVPPSTAQYRPRCRRVPATGS